MLALSEQDLKKILQRQNLALYELLTKRDQLQPGTTRYDIIQEKLKNETGETALILQLIEYTKGKCNLEDVGKPVDLSAFLR